VGIGLVLAAPVTQRLFGHAEALGELAWGAAGTEHLHRLATELRRVRGSGLGHVGHHPFAPSGRKRSDVRKGGGTPQWLSAQTFEHPETELALIDLLVAVDGLSARRAALDQRLSRIAQDPRLWPTIARLRCFRGVDTLTALMLHLELGGDWQRFRAPRKLSSWLGLVPSLEQSGESRTQGAITKTGSSIARRLLVEAAWHYARQPYTGPTIQARQAGQPEHIVQIATRAQYRLHRVHHRLRRRGKPGNVATIAVARELAGFLWAAATAP
jgi:transposase